MNKNTAGQSIVLQAFDSTTGLEKTGDAANMLFYVRKDGGSVTAIAANSGVPTEMDASHAKGMYEIALAQGETNGDRLIFTGVSVTANIVILPMTIYTTPPGFADIFTTALTESYAAVGVAPTLAQLLFMINQTVSQFSISGTTVTGKKIDGITPGMTWTLDSANPTSRVRAT